MQTIEIARYKHLDVTENRMFIEITFYSFNGINILIVVVSSSQRNKKAAF